MGYPEKARILLERGMKMQPTEWKLAQEVVLHHVHNHRFDISVIHVICRHEEMNMNKLCYFVFSLFNNILRQDGYGLSSFSLVNGRVLYIMKNRMN